MRIPADHDLSRRLHLSVIACCAASLPFALAGGRTLLGIPLVWAVGALEHRIWRGRQLARRRAAEAGPGAGVMEHLPVVAPMHALLDDAEREELARLCAVFLAEHPVTGVAGAPVSPRTRALVASAAVTLVRGRPEWEYPPFGEVLVYPGIFEGDGSFRLVTGRGGGGVLGMAHGLGPVILSLPHLEGFPGAVLALHEFAHVLDGVRDADGVPDQLDRASANEWRAVMEVEMPAGLPAEGPARRVEYAHASEFFADAAAMFFTDPGLLASRRPSLYAGLERVFRQDPLASRRPRE